MFIDFKGFQLMISILKLFLRQMLRKALIVDGGDTKFIQGDQVSYAELVEENAKVESQAILQQNLKEFF